MSLIQFLKTKERTQLYLLLLWVFYALWMFFQALFTLLLDVSLFVFLGTYSMIGILLFAVILGEHMVRGKQDWRILLVVVCGIFLFIFSTFRTSDLIPWPSIELFPPRGVLYLNDLNSLYDIGYNIMFMSFSFAIFYYMALLKVHLSSEEKQISNYIIVGGITLGLLPHLSSIVLSSYPPNFLVLGGVERLFYFPGFEFILVAIGALIISYAFKKEPKLNQAYQFIIKTE